MIQEIVVKTVLKRVCCDGCGKIIAVDGVTSTDHDNFLIAEEFTFSGHHLCNSCYDIARQQIKKQICEAIKSGEFKKWLPENDTLNKIRTGQL